LKTTTLYLANSLPSKLPNFFRKFEQILKENNLVFELIPCTKDIWARDYMPVQVSANRLVQFVYNPDYLQPKKYRSTISDVNTICNKMGLYPVKSNIVLDGGNVIRLRNKVIMTDKIFNENPSISKEVLLNEIENLLETDNLIIIPKDPADFTGHIDGMVRFVNDSTVLVNDYSIDNPSLQKSITSSLQNSGLNLIPIPYCPKQNDFDSAHGVYTNFLQVNDYIFIPTFGITEDKKVIKLFEELFPNHAIKSIDCTDLAPHGGLLNCISWEIKMN